MSEQRDAEHFVLVDLEADAVGQRRPKRPVDKTFRRYDQDQPMLLAPDIRDWVGPGHPARWVNDLVEDGLDLGPIYDDYTEVPSVAGLAPARVLLVEPVLVRHRRSWRRRARRTADRLVRRWRRVPASRAQGASKARRPGRSGSCSTSRLGRERRVAFL